VRERGIAGSTERLASLQSTGSLVFPDVANIQLRTQHEGHCLIMAQPSRYLTQKAQIGSQTMSFRQRTQPHLA